VGSALALRAICGLSHAPLKSRRPERFGTLIRSAVEQVLAGYASDYVADTKTKVPLRGFLEICFVHVQSESYRISGDPNRGDHRHNSRGLSRFPLDSNKENGSLTVAIAHRKFITRRGLR
jgi:hypothetical protein